MTDHERALIKDNANNRPRDYKLRFECETCGKEVITRAIIIRSKDTLLCPGCAISKTKRAFSEDKLESILDKRISTCQEKYGTTNGGGIPEAVQKAKDTFKEKYGSLEEAYSQRHLKKLETCKNLYGEENIMKTDLGKTRLRESIEKKYGSVEKAYEGRSDKAKETFLKNYGVDCSLQDPRVKDKARKTLIATYGVDHPMKSKKIKDKMVEDFGQIGRVRGYMYKEIHFDSSWELATYIWLVDNGKKFIYHPVMPFTYIGDDGLDHQGYPDFLIEGKFYELKGSQFFNEKHEPFNKYNSKYWWGKFQAMKENNINILEESDIKPYLEYVKNTYGKKYLKSFKVN